jgi:hypothetical protein
MTDVSALAATKAATTTVMGAANDVPLPHPRPMLKTNLFIQFSVPRQSPAYEPTRNNAFAAAAVSQGHTTLSVAIFVLS